MLRAGLVVLAHPSLWLTGVRQMWRLRRRQWWRRAPFLPLPGQGYLRFRMVTAYGDPDRAIEPADLVTYLRWCRGWPALTA
jgi:hypothetical protein